MHCPWKGCVRRSFASVQPPPSRKENTFALRAAWLRPTRRPAQGRSGARACPLPCRPHPAGRACSAQDGGPGRLLWQRTKRAGGASGRRGREGRPAGRAGARGAIVRAGSHRPCQRVAVPQERSAGPTRSTTCAQGPRARAWLRKDPRPAHTSHAARSARQGKWQAPGQMPEAGDARGRCGRGGCAEVRA